MRLDVDIAAKAFGAHQALGRVAFALGPGEVGAIVGPSGCGKTSLLRLIAGLERDFDGRIERPGARRLGVVFQEPRLLPWRSVDDNIRLVEPGIAEPRLAGLFAAFGLGAHRAHYPGALSLGLARRVAIVRALAVDPELLLLDEPFASLDEKTVAGMVAELAALFDARAITALLVTHDVGTAVRLADRIFVLSARPGRLAMTIGVPTPRAALGAAAAKALEARVRAAT